MMRATQVHQRLKDNNYRSTRTRDAVVDFLSGQRYLLSIDQVSNATSLDPVTVYRVMDVLEQLGIVHKLQSEAVFCTMPVSLWDEESVAILIDKSAQKITLRRYTPERHDITPTRSVVEIWGKLSNDRQTVVKQSSHSIESEQQSETTEQKDGEKMLDSDLQSDQKNNPIEHSPTSPTSPTLSSSHIDLLHQF